MGKVSLIILCLLVATVRARRRTRVSVCVNVPGSGTRPTLCRRATVGNRHRTLVIGIRVPRASSAPGNALTGKVDLGTGLRIAVRQMAAEELGLPVEKVDLVEGDLPAAIDHAIKARYPITGTRPHLLTSFRAAEWRRHAGVGSAVSQGC